MFVLAVCCNLFVCALSGSIKSWKLKESVVSHANEPSAMAFVRAVGKAIVFGSLTVNDTDFAYVSTLTDQNQLGKCSILKPVTTVNSAMAHPILDNIVLFVGSAMAERSANSSEVIGSAFVGALSVASDIQFQWAMFEVIGESGIGQQMHVIEVLSALNLFVAVGNSAAAGMGEGMLFAAFDLSSLSLVYCMQHTANYEPNGEGTAIPRAVARMAANGLVVANDGYGGYPHGHGLCSFKASRETLTVDWCHRISSDSHYGRYSIVGAHVVAENNSILVVGCKFIYPSGPNCIPFVKEFGSDGSAQLQQLAEWSSANDRMYPLIYASFYDSDSGTVYMGGSHYEAGYRMAHIITYNVAGHFLQTAVGRGAKHNNVDYWPDAVRTMSKTESGSKLYACDARHRHRPNEAALVTISNSGCLKSVLCDYSLRSEKSVNCSVVETTYMGPFNYTATDSPEIYALHSYDTECSESLCSAQQSLDAAEIAGIVIGSVLGFCLIIGCIVKLKSNGKSPQTTVANTGDECENGELNEASERRLAELELANAQRMYASG